MRRNTENLLPSIRTSVFRSGRRRMRKGADLMGTRPCRCGEDQVMRKGSSYGASRMRKRRRRSYLMSSGSVSRWSRWDRKAYLANQDGAAYAKCPEVKPIDTTGAGDIFGGSAVSRLLKTGESAGKTDGRRTCLTVSSPARRRVFQQRSRAGSRVFRRKEDVLDYFFIGRNFLN